MFCPCWRQLCKEGWRDKPWWCEHVSGVSGKLCSPGDQCSSPFFSPETHFHLIVTAEQVLFKDSCWVQWALKRGHNEWASPVVWGGQSISSLFLCKSLFCCCAGSDGAGHGQSEHPHPSWLHPRSSSMGFTPSHPFPGLDQACWVKNSNVCLPLVLQTDKI